MQMNQILDKIPLGIILFDSSNQLISINQNGKLYLEKTGDFLLEVIADLVKRTFENKVPVVKMIKYSNVNSLYVWKIKTEYLSSSSPQVMVVIQDETINSQLEQAVLKAEKLAVAGQLAIGSLVEIRNPLTSARGFCQLIEQSEVHKEYIEIIARELEQIQHIVSSCSSLANKSPANNLELIQQKFLACIHNQIDCYRLMLVRDVYDNLVINAADEQVNILINDIISLLNSWLEDNVCIIINSELAKEASYLNFSIRAHSNILYRPTSLKETIKCQICKNNEINFEFIDNTLAVNLQLPIVIQRYPN